MVLPQTETISIVLQKVTSHIIYIILILPLRKNLLGSKRKANICYDQLQKGGISTLFQTDIQKGTEYTKTKLNTDNEQ